MRKMSEEPVCTGFTDIKDLLAMVTFQLSVENLKLEDKNDTSPFTEKIQELTDELESYLKDK